jgi:hypothetical protein
VPRGRMRASILLCILAGAMSAQDFNGVTVSGAGGQCTIVNHSNKPLIGYALQGHTATGLRSVFGFTHTGTGRKHIPGHVDFGSWAVGKPMQPGEERHAAMIGGFTTSRLVRGGAAPVFEEIPAEEEEILSYELTAVLFADGTFIGPDDILADFSKQIHTARSLAQNTQLLEDKYAALKQHEFVNAMRRFNASTDMEALMPRSNVAHAILRIWDAQGEQEAEAALARLAALPDVRAVA